MVTLNVVNAFALLIAEEFVALGRRTKWVPMVLPGVFQVIVVSFQSTRIRCRP